MIKYKNSLLSAAAILALSSTVAVANYIPLSSDSADNEWVILGVSGLKTDGVVAAVAGEFSIADTTANKVEDLGGTVDAVEGTGLTVAGGDLGQVKVVDATALNLEVRVDTTTVPVLYLETDPIRTMYIDVSTEEAIGAPAFAFSYKSSLEGRRLEYSVASGSSYFVTIDSDNTFDNPQKGVKTKTSDGDTGNQLNSLIKLDAKSVVDYAFADNPPSADEWNAASYRNDSDGDDRLRVYTYDAGKTQWDIFDSENATDTNDFTDVIKGKGYWAKMDTGVSKEAGLILGTPSLSTTDYTNAGLVGGWNFIAFDGLNSQIRNAATGMVVNLVGAATDDFSITDSSGNHVITVDVDVTGEEEIAKDINRVIATQKLLGEIPYTVNITAFPSDTNEIVIISNKKFQIAEIAGNTLFGATTLAGESLLDPTTLGDTGNGANVTTDGVMTKYGEYAMVIQPVVGSVNGTDAQSFDDATMEISAASVAVDTSVLFDTAGNNLAGVATDIVADFDTATAGNMMVTELSLDLNATRQHLLLASTEPFDIRDRTFSRVFKYNSLGTAGASSITITSAGADNGTVAITNGTDADTEAAAIVTGGFINADDDGAGNIVIISNDPLAKNMFVAETTAFDNLQATTSTADIALGSVSGVYSLGYLAKRGTKNVLSVDIDEISDFAADATIFNYTTVLGTVVHGSSVAPTVVANTTVDATNKVFFDELVAQITTDLVDLNLTGTVDHNYTIAATPATQFGNTLITIESSDIVDFDSNATDAGGGTAWADDAASDVAAQVDLGYLSSYSPDITSDLKFNYVQTPDYSMKGPLYTMRENNMNLRALVTGNTDVAGGGVVSWESVDLTRNPSEWFDSQDYDLFDVDAKAGYWAYLEADASPSPVELFSVDAGGLTYTHHFDNDGTTTNSFEVDIHVITKGLDLFEDKFNSPRVTATMGGQTFDLKQDPSNANKFDGTLSLHEAVGIAAGGHYDVTVRAADGFGHSAKTIYPLLIDNKKPKAPVVLAANGEFSISADPTDTDVKGFYIYSKKPEERATDTDLDILTRLTEAGTSSGACAGQTASSAADTANGLTIFAIDAGGAFGTGNFSDSTSEQFMPIMVSRALISDTNNGAIDATGDATLYDVNCSSVGDLSYASGVTLTAITDPSTVSLAFAPKGENINNDIPITTYVTDGTTIAKITYPEEYAGTDVFVRLADDKVWGLTLFTRTISETNAAGGLDSTNPYTLLLNKDGIQF